MAERRSGVVRLVIYGAGAIGGVIGARLFQGGNDVTLVARGDNYEALAAQGLRLETREEQSTLPISVVRDMSELDLSTDDVVIITVKSNDTMTVLEDLSRFAPPEIAIVCAQNGIENERLALRKFANVYGLCVMLPASHLTPGVVRASSVPITGLLDLGRWPNGVDERAREIARILSASTFESVPRDDIARWKWGKLLMNLGNAVQAVCGNEEPAKELTRRVREEGIAVLQGAGIDYVDRDEDTARRGTLLDSGPRGDTRGGGSSWQSLVRATGSIETDYLTGEIVLRGRLHGVATPVNSLLQRLANQLARERRPPGEWSEADVLSMLKD
jgi:2-dehydropantoate 2-reductase